MTDDALVKFKIIQKESWSLFAPLEVVTTITAATLVNFSRVSSSHFRNELEALALPYFVNNHIQQHYLMSRAKKRF